MLVEATGPAHPDEVWRRFTDPAEWTVWAPQVRDVQTDAAVLAVGVTGRVHGPAGLAVDFRITELDPGLRSWTWEVGRASARVRMDHHVLPAPGGGSHALVRVHPPTASLVQPYRVPAGMALRRLVRTTGGADATPEAVQSFDFAFAPSYALAARAFGIRPGTTTVEVGPRWLYVRYGPWRLATPRDNIASAQLTGGFSFVKTAGPPHLSFTDRGVSMTTNGDTALCLTFHEPVPAIDPTATITHPGATLSVADPHGLAEALGFTV
ncbi:hypothetical protein GCM10011376_26940 [Nocardioides flavus (ex Wang et al. 2016)]|uniref:Polyketide cyclase / dehydrase and lipid transport n=1 Tax=Nocardioides flavus (ex Wang et al. 2016) TaxID=2058780 RepID=A0ABQ3HN49_9ACTN|nr:SRPBCC family protein [Nocardioides flavus (ex Wang et al. 2016)]GHE18084.1 hypothetical protein GCM10011376_26940 [Nocardioides flavus (ex Wang et al. 2016)]